MEEDHEEDIFGPLLQRERPLRRYEPEMEQAISVINQKDEMIYDLRRHYGGIINRQSTFIDLLLQKLDMLKAIIGILIVIALIFRFSSSPCEADPNNTSRIQQECIERKSVYNCEKDSSKNNPNWKMCESIALCLKDPFAYKQAQDNKKWEEMIN